MWTEPCAMCWVDICVCLQIFKKVKQVKKDKKKKKLKSASSWTLNMRATKRIPVFVSVGEFHFYFSFIFFNVLFVSFCF